MDDNTRRLDEIVKSIKANENVGKRYMKSWERERILREEAIAEGRAEGREKGLEEGREEERANTERERKRADEEKQRADKAEQELKEAQALIAELKEATVAKK